MNLKQLRAIWCYLEKNYDVSGVEDKCGVEVLGSKIRFNKDGTGGVSKAMLRVAYNQNNCCPRLRTNVPKKTLIQALMRC